MVDFGQINLHVQVTCCCIINHSKPSSLKYRWLLFFMHLQFEVCRGQLVFVPMVSVDIAQSLWSLESYEDFHSNICDWCWFLARTLVGSGIEAFPYGCLASLQHGDWVLRVSIQAGGARRKLCHLLWPSLHSFQLYFCHILFIRSESLRLAHVQRAGTNSTFWWETCPRICGHVLKPPHY